MNGIGRPAAANSEVAVIVAVPGTPTVPMDTSRASTTRNRNWAGEYEIPWAFTANTASSTGHTPAHPGMPRFAPRLATKDAISPGTPLERRLRTVTGIVPMLLSEVNATTPVGQYALKNGIGLRRVVTDRMSGCTMNSCRIIATYATTSTVTSGSSAATSLLLTAAAISASTAYGVNPTTICVALDSTTLPASTNALNGLTAAAPLAVLAAEL